MPKPPKMKQEKWDSLTYYEKMVYDMGQRPWVWVGISKVRWDELRESDKRALMRGG